MRNPAEPRSSPATKATQEPAERAKQPPKQAAAAAPGEAQQQQKQPTSTFNATVYIPSSPRGCQHLQFGARRRPRSSGAYSLAAKSASSLKNISCLGAGARIAGPLCKGWCDQRLCFQRCLATALCYQEPLLKTHSFLAAAENFKISCFAKLVLNILLLCFTSVRSGSVSVRSSFCGVPGVPR